MGTPGGDGQSCTKPAAASGVSVGAAYASAYSLYKLPGIPGLPQEKFGGLTLKSGDPNTLLIGGYAKANDTGALYAISVTRSCGHITGFSGMPTKLATTPDIDGSIELAPSGVLLFTGYPANTLGQLPQGADFPARTIDLTKLGIAASVGTLKVVPKGFPGEGTIKIVSADTGDYYHAVLMPDASGLYDVTGVEHRLVLPGGPEGIAYVPHGSPQFSADSMIVSEWTGNAVATYEIDGSADPVLATRKPFLQGITGAEGAFFDVVTGDFLFSTWNESDATDQLYVVQGFAPPVR